MSDFWTRITWLILIVSFIAEAIIFIRYESEKEKEIEERKRREMKMGELTDLMQGQEIVRLNEEIEKLKAVIDLQRDALKNINSIDKKQFEELPVYWAMAVNIASGEAIAAAEKMMGDV